MAQQRLTLRPTLNPFKQGTGLIPVRLAGGLGRIEVNMRFNKRGDGQPAARIQHFKILFARLPHRGDIPEAPLVYRYLP